MERKQPNTQTINKSIKQQTNKQKNFWTTISSHHGEGWPRDSELSARCPSISLPHRTQVMPHNKTHMWALNWVKMCDMYLAPCNHFATSLSCTSLSFPCEIADTYRACQIRASSTSTAPFLSFLPLPKPSISIQFSYHKLSYFRRLLDIHKPQVAVETKR